MSAAPVAPPRDRAPGDWIAPLVATLVVQAVLSFLSRLPPTLAPRLTAERGLDPAAIGYLSGAGMLGAMAFLLCGAPVLRRFGALRALQMGLLLGALGVVLIAVPWAGALLAAVILMGIGYGPSTPAGSDILQRFAPAHRRSLVFSIKQAGVPAGGMLAGLLLPVLVERFGLAVALAACAALALATILAMEPLRARLDPAPAAPETLRLKDVLALDNLTLPLRSLRDTPGLMRLALTGLALAVSQGVWIAFLVTALVEQAGVSLIAAGALFAVMQVTGMAGRIGLGWIADKIGSGRATLRGAAILSALCTLALAFVGHGTPLFVTAALCALAGATVTGWNGVQIAEVARLSRPGTIRETAAGATFLLFTGYVLGPAAFAAAVTAYGGYGAPLLAVSALTAASALVPRAAQPAH